MLQHVFHHHSEFYRELVTDFQKYRDIVLSNKGAQRKDETIPQEKGNINYYEKSKMGLKDAIHNRLNIKVETQIVSNWEVFGSSNSNNHLQIKQYKYAVGDSIYLLHLCLIDEKVKDAVLTNKPNYKKIIAKYENRPDLLLTHWFKSLSSKISSMKSHVDDFKEFVKENYPKWNDELDCIEPPKKKTPELDTTLKYINLRLNILELEIDLIESKQIEILSSFECFSNSIDSKKYINNLELIYKAYIDTYKNIDRKKIDDFHDLTNKFKEIASATIVNNSNDIDKNNMLLKQKQQQQQQLKQIKAYLVKSFPITSSEADFALNKNNFDFSETFKKDVLICIYQITRYYRLLKKIMPNSNINAAILRNLSSQMKKKFIVFNYKTLNGPIEIRLPHDQKCYGYLAEMVAPVFKSIEGFEYNIEYSSDKNSTNSNAKIVSWSSNQNASNNENSEFIDNQFDSLVNNNNNSSNQSTGQKLETNQKEKIYINDYNSSDDEKMERDNNDSFGKINNLTFTHG